MLITTFILFVICILHSYKCLFSAGRNNFQRLQNGNWCNKTTLEQFTFSIRKTDPEKGHFLFFLAEASSILCGASAPFCLLSSRLLSHLLFGHCCDEKFPFYISSQRKSARQGLKRGSLLLLPRILAKQPPHKNWHKLSTEKWILL